MRSVYAKEDCASIKPQGLLDVQSFCLQHIIIINVAYYNECRKRYIVRHSEVFK
jgi:hypothetical protein